MIELKHCNCQGLVGVIGQLHTTPTTLPPVKEHKAPTAKDDVWSLEPCLDCLEKR